MLSHVRGFPVPSFREGRKNDPQAGCPFGDNVAAVTREQVDESLRSVLDLPVDEVWGLTVDEIGTVIDRSAEKKGHLAACPRCTSAFQRWLAAKDLTPRDFGAADWSEVKPFNVWNKDSDRPWLEDRGTAVQRMLSVVSRGDTMLYWYTYGPDYKKGDSFSKS
jgi:hypothetical protein